MRELRQPLARLDLSEPAATTFVEQSADQRPCTRITLAISAICHQYFCQMPGSRNKTSLPGGRLLSLIPQRCNSRQSYFGDANPIGADLILPAFLPPRMRIATSTVFELVAAIECIGPPTVSRPKKGFLEGKDRGVRERVQIVQGKIAFMGDTCRVDRHQAPEQDCVRRKHCRPFQYLLERQIGEPDECDPVLKGLCFPLDFLKPEFFQGARHRSRRQSSAYRAAPEECWQKNC